MKFIPVVIGLTFAAICAMPAAAQFGAPEKSNSEILLEKTMDAKAVATANFETAKTECASKSYSACYTLGEAYRQGTGVLQNYELAAESYDAACKGGNANGCAGLAYLTTHGRGVSKDLPKSRALFKKSCDLGLASGCAGYGNMVYTGTGGRKNVELGTRHLRQACDAEYAWACERLEALGARDPGNSAYDRLEDIRSRR